MIEKIKSLSVEEKKELLASPECVKMFDANGSTALHHLAAYGEEEIQLLVLDHPSVNRIRNKDGITPLQCLGHKGTKKVRDKIIRRLKARRLPFSVTNVPFGMKV